MTDDVFEDLVNLYLDKEISPAQLTILRGELSRNYDRQKTFESYCRMHQATHFAALSACPVIPRLSHSLSGKTKPAFFAHNKQVWAAAVLIAVIGSFATVYFNGPFGSARIVQAKGNNLQKIETFAQTTGAQVEEPPLEFFRALKAQNQVEAWAYIQELRHARATSNFQSIQQPSLYTWTDVLPEDNLETENDYGFNAEYSSYEFKR